jgi:phosphohistidine phosphatase SixA
MRILAVRHGEAGDAEDFARNGRPGHLRALTARGSKRMWLAAREIIRELPFIDALATSPLCAHRADGGNPVAGL